MHTNIIHSRGWRSGCGAMLRASAVAALTCSLSTPLAPTYQSTQQGA
jgi:hypothetical protein